MKNKLYVFGEWLGLVSFVYLVKYVVWIFFVKYNIENLVVESFVKKIICYSL